MPTVDFTKAELLAELDMMMDHKLDEKLDLKLEPLRQEVGLLKTEFNCLRAELEDFQGTVNDSFQELTDDMNRQFAEVRGELRGIRRVIRQHSADIAELKAAQG